MVPSGDRSFVLRGADDERRLRHARSVCGEVIFEMAHDVLRKHNECTREGYAQDRKARQTMNLT